ncbi:MAG: hypothetical protein ACREMP_07435 [Candidatus Tyrphobacter sp.]
MRRWVGLAGAAIAFFIAGMSVQAAAGIFGSWVSCSPGTRGACLDAAWWQHLSPSSKPSVAEGMISSYIAGFRLARFNVYSMWLDAYGTGPQTRADKAFLKYFRSIDAPAFNESPSAYASAIDRFYRKYPSKRRLEVAGVLRCLAAHAQFSCDTVGRSMLLPWPTGP